MKSSFLLASILVSVLLYWVALSSRKRTKLGLTIKQESKRNFFDTTTVTASEQAGMQQCQSVELRGRGMQNQPKQRVWSRAAWRPLSSSSNGDGGDDRLTPSLSNRHRQHAFILILKPTSIQDLLYSGRLWLWCTKAGVLWPALFIKNPCQDSRK